MAIGIEGLGQGADLVQLDEDRVRDAVLDARARILVLVTKRSSPTSCTSVAEPGRQRRPAVPVASSMPSSMDTIG
jgi:hypothetical protein